MAILDPFRSSPPVNLADPASVASNLDAVALEIVERVTTMLGSERSALYLLDESTGELVTRHAQGARITIRVARGHGIIGWVAQHRRPARVDDAYADPRFVRAWDQASGKRTRSLIAVPLENPAGDLVGVIASLNKKGGFDALDEGAMCALAAVAAVRLDHTRVVRRIESRNREITTPVPEITVELEVLKDLDEALARARDPRMAVEAVLERLLEVFAAPVAAGLLPGPEPVFVIDRGVESATRRVRPELANAALNRFEIDGPELPGLLGAEAPPGTQIIRALVDVRGRRAGIIELYHHTNPGPDPTIVAAAARRLGRALELLERPPQDTQVERLAVVGQAIGTFVHDLRLPLSAAVGYAEMLAEDAEPHERTHFVRQIRAALREIDEMATDILDFVRGESPIHPEVVDLRGFVESLVLQLEPDLDRHQARLEVTGVSEGRIRLDAARMRRALANLAMNAVQAGANEVFVALHRAPGCFTFRITDNGKGIPVDVRDRLFQPFATSGKKGGTGLGLASARRTVEAHGGTLELVETSTTGTVFQIALPE